MLGVREASAQMPSIDRQNSAWYRADVKSKSLRSALLNRGTSASHQFVSYPQDSQRIEGTSG